MTLQRLVLDYRSGELVLRALYRSQDGPGPGFAGPGDANTEGRFSFLSIASPSSEKIVKGAPM